MVREREREEKWILRERRVGGGSAWENYKSLKDEAVDLQRGKMKSRHKGFFCL